MNAYLASLRQEYLITAQTPVRANYQAYFSKLNQGSYLLMRSPQLAEIDTVLDYYGILAQALLLRVVEEVPRALALEIHTVKGNKFVSEQGLVTNRLLAEVVHHLVSDPRFASSALRSLPETSQIDLFERSLLIAKPVVRSRFVWSFLEMIEGREVENLSLKELQSILTEPEQLAERLEVLDGLDALGRAVIGFFDYMRFIVSFAELLETLEQSLLVRSILWYQFAPLFMRRHRTSRTTTRELVALLARTLQSTRHSDFDIVQIGQDMDRVERSLAFLHDESLGAELEDFLGEHKSDGGLEIPPNTNNPMVGPDEVVVVGENEEELAELENEPAYY